ncbi:MAG: N-acetyl-gamma-glutamyl-phosphate reductase [Candidatus Thiodiazotropha endolucinida]|uniref:N-acetyl-gamma-glutamyl-phosphate reductase n=2 Tax=Candidatus Thiodiazotropha TaxID=1913444 RepID=A0A7Z0VKZ7_9GAMM|nr:N-acetyl-gamma-glutamyl-phosphate reductase [Candidatus Thiodiazotropha endolucinida]MBT3040150.1 N-acetyl-gamma-glutamyl-phosphate reductase [Candidatus Thiodiazotropha sp. (ex Codakia orbicularis)]MBV2126987.1 N-acetyl-gamma-glutamyl-phosphate reductase [Candidatus Thiodiazotropha taylori]MCG7978475.1 N-acetyl-gamma-glutamyl-phosphate reductase [Candidatus Thiodiazotropha taylori]MCW4236608.1 N-acetyl-gamma-glutamyl-phosphate reductase [Candidatus Thiodiazotropha endolucinida]ODJ87503.1 N
MIKVGVVGGTGYTGVELLRLLVAHPSCELVAITSRAESGKAVADLFPNLRGLTDLSFVAPDAAQLGECDLVFFATPNGVAMTQVPELVAGGVRVIDLAADFRIADQAVWEQWYGMRHACPELLPEAVYGLPELNRQAIREARLVANPGCYPTAVALGFLPLIEDGLVACDFLVADTKSGVSGAGRSANVAMLMGEMGESFKAYAIPGHRHQPEIRQTLSRVSDEPVGLTFVPHLVPMIRGIEATLYARLTDRSVDLQALFEKRYRQDCFVDIMPPGSHPETRSVKGANHCRIAVHSPREGDVVVVSSVIDNLVKGAAGQAVQNMNLMFDLNEDCGLNQVALLP